MSKIIEKQYDVIVIGGGVAGVCAAIASARHGAKTVLIHDRPVPGGNASSEIRMHICGASCHGARPNARETGILEEILLENKHRNPNHSFSILDTVFWEKLRFQENLTLYLNTRVTLADTRNGRVISADAIQTTTEKTFRFYGRIFIDCTGDGGFAAAAGAEYMLGRESKDTFGEADAPDAADSYTMGSSLMFKAVDMGRPTPYTAPHWANRYSEADLAMRLHEEISSGYWWIELGGGALKVIDDAEEIRDELLAAVYGVWDHIKNGGAHGAENYALDWVGFLPGKRESRRITGDYVLTEQDVLTARPFADAVAYGGWPMDMHVPEGLLTQNSEASRYISLSACYSIPYRCLCAKDMENLMMAGRNISASHLAFSSARVMGTCGVAGQAAGTAAAMAFQKALTPREMTAHMQELQTALLNDDCYIPGLRSSDKRNIAPSAQVSCSSAAASGACENVTNGFCRAEGDKTNCWISAPFGKEPQRLEFSFLAAVSVSKVDIVFDSNLSAEIMPSLSEFRQNEQCEGVPKELVRDYKILCLLGGAVVHEQAITGNYQRLRSHAVNLACDTVKIFVSAANGGDCARIFEVRIFGA